MSKKILLSIAPILVLAALAVAPSMAGAAEYGTCAKGTPENKPPCLAGEKFTPFPAGTSEKIVIKKVPGSSPFFIENDSKSRGIRCETLSGKGTVENVEGRGVHREEWSFGGCTPKALAGCTEINPKTHQEIIGDVNGNILSNKKIEVHIESGFDVRCLIAEKEGDFGSMYGTAESSIKHNELIFKETRGFNAPLGLPEESNITGSYEMETEVGKATILVK